MVLYAAGSGGLAWMITPIIDHGLVSPQGVGLIATGIVAVFFLKGVGSYVSSYLMADVGQRVVTDLRNALFERILKQSAKFFADRDTGDLLSRINNDVARVQQVVTDTVADLARETLALVAYVGLLFWTDARLAISSLIVAPIIIYPLVRLGQRVRRTTLRSQEAISRLTHISKEAFDGHRIVKAFGTERLETGKFAAAGYHLYRTNMKVTAALSSLPPLMELIGGIGMAIAVWYGSRQIAAGNLSAGQFGRFVGTLLLMYAPAKKLSRVNADLQQAMAASERIFTTLDEDTEVPERAGAPALVRLRDAIEFRDVMFGYEDAHGRQSHTLRGVSFDVRAGHMVAVVGRSGAGKTTLVNLLPRFYDVDGGAILIDGVDIRDVSLTSLRAQIGIVTQETFLFDDTIATNIAYGANGATRQMIEAAARAAHAQEFIEPMPLGYDTVIGERGTRLSGGQKQRLAIARALLKNAPILVLDEATSALDTESELLVQEALSTLMHGRTSFVIAHRLSTIQRADAIVVLEKGRIVEIGRHDELLARAGTYANLYQMQLLEGRKSRPTGGVMPS